MKLLKSAGRIKADCQLQLCLLKEAWHFWLLTRKYNASRKTDEDIEKMQYTILRQNHTLEKGLSLRNPERGFGQKKVSVLLERLESYHRLYGSIDKDFLLYPLRTICLYIHHTKQNGVDIPEIEQQFDRVVRLAGFHDITPAESTRIESRQHLQQGGIGDFGQLLESRHSVRHFASQDVSEELIEKALRLAQKTPSACNRQGWKTHVFRHEACLQLIQWQGGARGFETEIPCAILVTANLKAFLSYEVHQAYVDGGLYAMNLINALHFLGLGTIPLSCGFEADKLSELGRFGIPENEVPILIVGTGQLEESVKVAFSSRKDISLTNTFH
ncbi:MAG: nitroreductase family protein [Bacteroidales bacterium]|nr:nitroreductase family protein [Bacteroidales bacterium]